MSSPITPLTKRKRVVLTIKEKLDICRKIQEGEKKQKLMEEYGVGLATLYDIADKSGQLENFDSKTEGNRTMGKRRTLHGTNLDQLEEILFKWYQLKMAEGIPLSGPLIIAKAKEIYGEMNTGTPFVFTGGWLKSFKSRHGIGVKRRLNDSTSAPEFCETIMNLEQEVNPFLSDVNDSNWEFLGFDAARAVIEPHQDLKNNAVESDTLETTKNEVNRSQHSVRKGKAATKANQGLGNTPMDSNRVEMTQNDVSNSRGSVRNGGRRKTTQNKKKKSLGSVRKRKKATEADQELENTAMDSERLEITQDDANKSRGGVRNGGRRKITRRRRSESRGGIKKGKTVIQLHHPPENTAMDDDRVETTQNDMNQSLGSVGNGGREKTTEDKIDNTLDTVRKGRIVTEEHHELENSATEDDRVEVTQNEISKSTGSIGNVPLMKNLMPDNDTNQDTTCTQPEKVEKDESNREAMEKVSLSEAFDAYSKLITFLEQQPLVTAREMMQIYAVGKKITKEREKSIKQSSVSTTPSTAFGKASRPTDTRESDPNLASVPTTTMSGIPASNPLSSSGTIIHVHCPRDAKVDVQRHDGTGFSLHLGMSPDEA